MRQRFGKIKNQQVASDHIIQSKSAEITKPFTAYSDIPPCALDNLQNTEISKEYLLCINVSEGGPLQEDKLMQSQLLISRFSPSQPLQSMIPYIRHTFVPIATLSAQKEEKQQVVSAAPHRKYKMKQAQKSKPKSWTKGILDKLRKLEQKLLEFQDDAQSQSAIWSSLAIRRLFVRF